MDLKNKNARFLNIDEEIVYIVENNAKDYYFLYLLLPLIFSLIFMINIPRFYGFTVITVAMELSIFSCLIPMVYFLKVITDKSCTDIILTNQRLVMLKHNKIIPIDYNKIKDLSNIIGKAGSHSGGIISLKNNKEYKIYSLDAGNLKNKIKEIYPEFQGTKNELTSKLDWAIITMGIFILIVSLPAIYYIALNS